MMNRCFIYFHACVLITVIPYTAVDSDDGGTEPGGAIRRACSLSDLANPSPRRTPVQGIHNCKKGKVKRSGSRLSSMAPQFFNCNVVEGIKFYQYML